MTCFSFPSAATVVGISATLAWLLSCSSDSGHSDPVVTGDPPGGAAGAAGSSDTSAMGGDMMVAGGAGGASEVGGGGMGGEAAGAGGMGEPQECEMPQADGPSSSRHTARPLGSTAATNGFYEYLPPGYGDGCPRPLLIFFPGSGELGNGTDELDRLLIHGPPKLIDQDVWPDDRPFIVLSVQHESGCRSADNVDGFIDFALENYDIDANQVYLTGLSCGGHRSWDYAGSHGAAKLAAIAPVAGDGRPTWDAVGCDLGLVGVWAFHGDADGSVDLEGSTDTIANLMTCPMPPAKEAKVTVYPGVGHDSWTMTYDLSAGNDLYTWMLGFRRSAP